MQTHRDGARPGRGLDRRQLVGALAAGVAVAASPAPSAAAPSDRLQTEEFRLPWSEPGVEIYVRNKRPAGIGPVPGRPDPALRPRATYPASTAFDLPLGGMSAMDYLAGLGFDV